MRGDVLGVKEYKVFGVTVLAALQAGAEPAQADYSAFVLRLIDQLLHEGI